MKKMIFILVLVMVAAAAESDESRIVRVKTSYAEIYSQPHDSLPPVRMARKDQLFHVYYSTSDDSGRVWFCLQTDPDKSDTGWVPARFLRYVPLQKDSAQTPLKRADSNAEKKRRYAELRKHPKWSRKIKQAIRNGEVVLYMTGEQLKACWGEPRQVIKNAFMVGVGDYSIYLYKGRKGKPDIVVTLQDGKVTGWSEE